MALHWRSAVQPRALGHLEARVRPLLEQTRCLAWQEKTFLRLGQAHMGAFAGNLSPLSGVNRCSAISKHWRLLDGIFRLNHWTREGQKALLLRNLQLSLERLALLALELLRRIENVAGGHDRICLLYVHFSAINLPDVYLMIIFIFA